MLMTTHRPIFLIGEGPVRGPSLVHDRPAMTAKADLHSESAELASED